MRKTKWSWRLAPRYELLRSRIQLSIAWSRSSSTPAALTDEERAYIGKRGRCAAEHVTVDGGQAIRANVVVLAAAA
jgi:hypothetical protein